ncbi:hypothetical protein [Haloferula sp. BvORR071]|uniref:hypothetical protein n=1 Tax=Haloferula sp. BvORR071 TaxID=1396141 RepID=UPI00054D0FCF|nr:hypothetical protein [Haloferula sp. BvORR071]
MILVVGLGFGAGFALHRGTRSTATPADHDPAPPQRTSSSGTRPPSADNLEATRSTDTIQDLLAADRSSFAGRFSLWLLDASAEDIAAFWDQYRQRNSYETDHWDKLVMFRRWIQLDPEGAIAAAKRDGAEESALWARAMLDPMSVLPAKPGFGSRWDDIATSAVMRFHPDLALKMIRDNPNLIADSDPDKIANEIAGDDREKALTYLVENGQLHLTEPLQRWTREDPQAAFAWMRLHWGLAEMKDDFLTMLGSEHPGLAKEFAAGLPEGAMKRDLAQLAFRELLKSDPAAALAAARAEPVPQPEQFAACARSMVDSDPQAALGLMVELFKLTPSPTVRTIRTYSPLDPTDSSSEEIPGPRDLVTDLVARDPQATMAAALQMPGDKTLVSQAYSLWSEDGEISYVGGDPRSLAANAWVRSDPAAFAEWCNGQEDQDLRSSGLKMAAAQFSTQERFPQAMEWAMELVGQDDSADAAVDVFKQWSSKNPEQAVRWLEETDLPDETRAAMQKTLKPAAP